MTALQEERQLDNVVNITATEAPRLLECARAVRELRFQHVARRYMSQILYGCTNTNCTTLTCLSCQKRLVSRPFRPPTQLTARALAYYLASQEHPYRRLCPHPLNIDPNLFEIKNTVVHPFSVCVSGGEPQVEDAPDHVNEAVAARHQARKDPKSLGQNLYDTVTMIFAYSKETPNPLRIFAATAEFLGEEPQHTNSPMPGSRAQIINDVPQGKISKTASTQVSSEYAPLSGVAPGSASPPHSRRGSRRLSKSSATQIASEILSNGHHSHKARHAPQNFGKMSQLKRTKSSSLDAMFDGTIDGGKNPTMSNPVQAQPGPVPTTSHLTCDIIDQFKDMVHPDLHFEALPRYSDSGVDCDKNRHPRPTIPFVDRSMFFALSDPETLLRSFRDDEDGDDEMDLPLAYLDAHRLTHAFRGWDHRNGALVYDSLWHAVEALFRSPPELDTQKSPRLKPSRKNAIPPPTSRQPSSSSTASQDICGRYLSNKEVVHIIMICIHALTALVPCGWPHTWIQVRKLRGWGVVTPGTPPHGDLPDNFAHSWLEIIDALEYEPAIRLATRLLRGIGARLCFEHILASIQFPDQDLDRINAPSSFLDILISHLKMVERAAVKRRARMMSSKNTEGDPGWTVTATFMEWLRTIIVKQWDGNVEINRWSSVGVAVTLMDRLFYAKCALNLRANMFLIPYLNERIDRLQAPIEFIKYRKRPNSIHIMQFPIFFLQDSVVGFFRTINFNRMFNEYEKSFGITHFRNRWDYIIRGPQHWLGVMHHLNLTMMNYLVLDVSRQDILKETLDQLWGQQRRKLLKPLKVKIGQDEGEVGLDHGGVTYEFFRLALSEAFQPEKGMFTVDSKTSMIWFQPASFEPLWKFEMLGVLFSLAVYNGITLPVTFPLVFYYDLLSSLDRPAVQVESFVDLIQDGWPELAKSFTTLLEFKGDVAAVFMRDFTFSFEAYGQNIDVDMQAFSECLNAWPGYNQKWQMDIPDLQDPAWRRPLRQLNGSYKGPMEVTNENRGDFVEAYVTWLILISVRPQLDAFRKGFHSCLERQSLRLFTAETLRALVEGSPTISIPLLKKVVTYDGDYSADHPSIIDFWSVVEGYSQEEVRKLLEFVTANGRIPVTGYDSVNFTILKFMGNIESLPTSSTCFGKLWLPDYADKEKMRVKLGIAIQNCKGFGSA